MNFSERISKRRRIFWLFLVVFGFFYSAFMIYKNAEKYFKMVFNKNLMFNFHYQISIQMLITNKIPLFDQADI